ncbi:MAG: HAD-IIIA family hydrolase [Candidatus Micrarchaeota archaeon]|nr:HAD-IIIA family hydrolase [Candidatus Micrarchaeota archaeon]
MNIKQAAILAGGRGTRLGELTKDTPKPMILLNGKPFLEYLVEMLRDNGIEEIVLLLGYLPDKIMNYFGDGSKFGIKITYSVGDVEFETGKRLKNAEKLLNDIFLLMYCDNYWPLRLDKLVAQYEKHKTLSTVTVYTNKNRITKNNMLLENDCVTKYDKSRQEPGLDAVDIGFVVIKKEAVSAMPDSNFSLEADFYPKLIEKGQMTAYQTDQKHYTIGTPEKLKITEEFLADKKIVLVDRDGVINKKAPKADYVKKWQEFKFLPKALDGLRLLKERGFKVIVITNQPGIARGLVTKEDLEEIHRNMINEIKKNGGKIDAIYACMHGWDDGCDCRKPKPGLLFRASDEFKFDLTKSFFITDDERDVIAGDESGCKNILITTDTYTNSIDKLKPQLICKNLYDAAKHIIEQSKVI